MLRCKRYNKQIMVVILFFAFWSIAWLDPYRDRVSEGNKQYHDQKYKEAKNKYIEAEKYVPRETDKLKLAFNKGNTDYKLGKYQDAITNYEKAIQSEDPEVQKKAFYNMGNSYVKLKKYNDAVKSFINALKIDPTYDKAKKNIEYLLKEQQKNKDNQNKDNQNKDKNSKENDKQNQKDKNNKDQNKKNQANKQQQKTNLNKEQRQNLLKEMQKKPVRRQKGSRHDRRYLEKYW